MCLAGCQPFVKFTASVAILQAMRNVSYKAGFRDVHVTGCQRAGEHRGDIDLHYVKITPHAVNLALAAWACKIFPPQTRVWIRGPRYYDLCRVFHPRLSRHLLKIIKASLTTPLVCCSNRLFVRDLFDWLITNNRWCKIIRPILNEA